MPRVIASRRGNATPHEIELKLALSALEVPALRQRLARFGNGEAVEVDNVYFDTAERLLAREGFTFRNVARTWYYLRDILAWYGPFTPPATRPSAGWG